MIIFETYHSVCSKQSIYSALQRVKGNDSRVVGSPLIGDRLDTVYYLLCYKQTKSFWMIIFETDLSVCAKQSIYTARFSALKATTPELLVLSPSCNSSIQTRSATVLLLYRVTAVLLYCIEYNMLYAIYILHTSMYETQSLTVQILYKLLLPKNLTTIGLTTYLIATARKTTKLYLVLYRYIKKVLMKNLKDLMII